MKTTTQKIIRYIKKNKVKSALALIVVVVIVLIATKKPAEIKREYVTIARTTVAQEVDVTGRIEPAQKVTLSTQSGGKVSSITTAIGKKVVAGQTLLSVNTSDLQVRLSRQRATLEKAKIILAKQGPKTTAHDTRADAYENGFNAVADTFLDIPSAVLEMKNIFNHDYLAHNLVTTRYGTRGITYRNDARAKYVTAEKAYDAALKNYKLLSRQSDPKAIEAVIEETYIATKAISDAVKTLKNFVDYIESENDISPSSDLASDQASLAAFTTQTNRHLSALLSIKTTIKNSNEGIIDQDYDLESIRLDIRQAELDIQDTLVQINERIIRAPMSGVITDIAVEVGETISGGSPVISLISSNQYQIVANLPESDIAKVQVGALADITLDAYGSDVPFSATVVSVHPSETLLDGVATYKTTLQFVENDDRIKSGMTADITIKGERKENVLAVPQRAVITKDGTKYVQILKEGVVEEVPVTTGLRGADGTVEIVSGITEGDMVIIFIDTK